MSRGKLAEEIIDFCTKYRLLDISKSKIENQLENSLFIEYLIHMLIIRAKYIRNMDFERLNKLLDELEKIRLELNGW